MMFSIGQKLQVKAYRPQSQGFRQRLLALGMTLGAIFTVENIAPLGDPILVRVRGTSISMRRQELALMECQQAE